MAKSNHMKVKLPNWWQTLIIAVVLITVFRTDPMTVFEAIKELVKYWLSG